MFSLDFDNLFSIIDLESLKMKENDTVVEVGNTLNRPSKRVVLTEANMETNNLLAPDESRFPLSLNEQIQETLKQKYSNVDVSLVETMVPVTLDEVLQKCYVEVRKQDGSEYEPDSLKVMQAALESFLSTRKYPYSIIISREFASSRAVLDAKPNN